MNFFQKFLDFVARPTHSRTMGLVAILVLAAAVSLTVYVSQQQQQLKQRAAESSLPSPISIAKCESNCLIDNLNKCEIIEPVTENNRQQIIDACKPLKSCNDGCPLVASYSSSILEAKDLTTLSSYLSGMKENVTITRQLTGDQYNMLYSQYYVPKLNQLTNASQSSSTPNPISSSKVLDQACYDNCIADYSDDEAGCANDCSSNPTPTPTPTICEGPSAPQCSDITTTSFKVSWNPVSGVNTYSVRFASGDSFKYALDATSPTTLTSLKPDTNYTIAVSDYGYEMPKLCVFPKNLWSSDITCKTLPTPTSTSTPIPTVISSVPTAIPSAAPALLAADVNQDGCVSISDFNEWLYAYQNNGTPRNPNYKPNIDGKDGVNLLDYNLWLTAMKSGQNLCGQ